MTILLHNIVCTGLDAQFKGLVEIHQASRERKICDPFELPAHRAEFCHVTASLTKGMTYVRDGAVAIIGDGFDHHGHAMWSISFIRDGFKRRALFILPGAASDGALDIILGRVFG